MKKLIALLLALCMVASLAACGPNDDKPTEPAKPDDSKPSASESGEAKDDVFQRTAEFQIMHSTDQTWYDVIDNYVKPALAEKFPNVKFQYNEIGDYNALAAVGELPDIGFAIQNTAMIESNISYDMHDDMAEFMKEHFKNPDCYTTSKGMQVSCGSATDNFYTGTYYYNKAIFDKEGLKAPTTYKEFEDLCLKLVDLGYPVPLSHSNWSFSCYPVEQTIIAHDPEAYDELVHNKIGWKDPRIVEAIKALDKLVHAGVFGKGLAEKDLTSSISEFVEGGVPMMSTYSWNTGSLAGKTDFEIGQFFMPSNNPKYPSGTVYPVWGCNHNGWFIANTSPDKELAVEVMKVIVSCEAQRMHDNGLDCGFNVEGELKFNNDLDKDRYENLYTKIERFMPALSANTWDETVNEEYQMLIAEWGMDKTEITADIFCDRMQAVWEENTYFDFF